MILKVGGVVAHGILREIQRALAIWIGTCPLYHHRTLPVGAAAV
jgi:hypothetical protein